MFKAFFGRGRATQFQNNIPKMARVWFTGGVLWHVSYKFLQILYTYPHFWVDQETKHIGSYIGLDILLKWTQNTNKLTKTLEILALLASWHYLYFWPSPGENVFSIFMMCSKSLFCVPLSSWNISINHIMMFTVLLHLIYSAVVNGTCSMWYSCYSHYSYLTHCPVLFTPFV